LPGDLIAIDLGKTDVDQGDLRAGGKDEVEARSPIGCRLDVVTVESQEYLKRLARIGMVLDHDDPTWRPRGELAIRGGRRGGRREGESDDKLAPLTKTCAVHRNAAVMMLDEAARDREAKPQSALTPVEGSLHLRKQLENGLERVRRQADAPILNPQHGLAAFPTHQHSNRLPRR
jgi:hypothetical protein